MMMIEEYLKRLMSPVRLSNEWIDSLTSSILVIRNDINRVALL